MGKSFNALDRAMGDRLDALIALFDPLANRADARPICWVAEGDVAETDYCPDCARWVARHIRRHNKNYRRASADGGWELHRESDSVSVCGGCGCLLSYSLSECGLRDEVDYWGDVASIELITSGEAFAIRAVLNASRYYPETLPDVLIIGERAAARLPKEARHG